jgi:serine protease Do
VIVQIVAGGPADKAGLKNSDVIVNMGGQDVNNIEDFTRILLASKIGVPLEIKYWRGKTENTVAVTPVESPKTTTS